MNKTLLKITLSVFAILLGNNTYAQEVESTKKEKVEIESESPFTVGMDIVSTYVWRGTKFSGPAIQPTLEYGVGGFSVGAWGSFDLVNGFNELDTYASYAFDFGLSLGLTDYYYQGSHAFDFADTTGSHALEANLNYTIKSISLSANYVINDTHAGGPGSTGGDIYFEAGYGFKYFDVFVGAGDGWHSKEGDFQVVNIGIGATKEIKISETFTLPVFGQLIINPNKEQYNLVVGISL